MTKIILFCVVALCSVGFVHAQTVSQDEQLVNETINQLFKGMESGDSAKMRALFTSQVTMATVFRDKSNNPVLERESSIKDWLTSVATPHKEVYFEEIWNVKIQLDGDFAQAWCDYAFYLGNKFNHCGVDAFQLHKEKDGWKIFHIADTRRKDNCTIPQTIQDKHK
jgi:hypothetical protein